MIANGQTFKNVPVYLDGGTFVDCTFESCQLIFSALMPVVMERCTFTGCRPSFIGAAGNTIQMMRAIYHGWGPDGRTLIDNTFNQIRQANPAASGENSALTK